MKYSKLEFSYLCNILNEFITKHICCFSKLFPIDNKIGKYYILIILYLGIMRNNQ